MNEIKGKTDLLVSIEVVDPRVLLGALLLTGSKLPLV